jgi:hypothetical protein
MHRRRSRTSKQGARIIRVLLGILGVDDAGTGNDEENNAKNDGRENSHNPTMHYSGISGNRQVDSMPEWAPPLLLLGCTWTRSRTFRWFANNPNTMLGVTRRQKL